MPVNAAIYLADPSMLGSRLFEKLEGIEQVEGLSNSDKATGIRFKTAWGTVQMNFMPEDRLPANLLGLTHYARQWIRDSDTLTYTLARIQHVRMCLGCVMNAAEDKADEVEDFLGHFTFFVGGLLFLYEVLFDWNGDPLCVPEHKASSGSRSG
jgi:hypothetical protein